MSMIYFLLSFSLISSPIAKSAALNVGLCSSSNCTGQFLGGAVGVCVDSDVSGRDGATTSLLTPQLQALAVFKQTNSNAITLNLTWVLPPTGPSPSGYEGFLLELAAAEDSDVYHAPACSQYNWNSASKSSVTSSLPCHFSSSCFRDLQLSKSYQLRFRMLPLGGATLHYTITLPATIATGWASWQTILGVSSASSSGEHSDVTMLFQPAPHQYNFTSYHLQLIASDSNEIISQKTVSQNVTRFTFKRIPVGSYSVKLRPLGGGCGDSCMVSSSYHTANTSQLTTSVLKTTTGGTTMSTSSASSSSSSSGATMHPSTSSPAPPQGTTSSATPPSPRVPTKTTRIPSTSTTRDGPEIKPSEEREIYMRNIRIVIGTVCGVVVLVLIGVLFFLIRRRRRQQSSSFQMQRFGTGRESDSSVQMEQAFKFQPTILILYSYDCPAHEKVVLSFAGYLNTTCRCNILLDVWQQVDIYEKGALVWLQEKLELSEFVLVICSTGARFKCSKNKSVYIKDDRNFVDMFSFAVDMIGEKMRLARNSGDPLEKFLVTYFDYSRPSDIPLKLDFAQKFSLTSDLFDLYCTCHGMKADVAQDVFSTEGLTSENFMKSDDGLQLWNAINDAKKFFDENPDWLGERLEPLTVIETKTMDSNQGSPSHQSNVGSSDQNSDSSQQPLLEHPVNGVKEPPENLHGDFVSGNPRRRSREANVIDVQVQYHPEPRTSLPLATQETGSSSLQVPPVVTPKITPSESPKTPPYISPPIYPPPKGASLSSLLLNNCDELDDMEQFQRDIDFIHDFDNKKRSNHDRIDYFPTMEAAMLTSNKYAPLMYPVVEPHIPTPPIQRSRSVEPRGSSIGLGAGDEDSGYNVWVHDPPPSPGSTHRQHPTSLAPQKAGFGALKSSTLEPLPLVPNVEANAPPKPGAENDPSKAYIPHVETRGQSLNSSDRQLTSL